MCNNPRGIRFSEAETLILREGWVIDNVVGSHYTFWKNGTRFVLVKPHGRQKHLHPKDVKKVLKHLGLLDV